MQTTKNYGLNMPEENDFYNVGDMNVNMEIIDREMKAAADAVQEEVNELKKSVSDGKRSVADAITGMGISTATDAAFETMAGNVEKITPEVSVNGSVSGSWSGAAFRYAGGATATAKINGKNQKQGSTSFTQQSTTVGGNAVASDVLSGKTFSSNNAGRAVNGTMTNRGAYTYDLFCVSKNGVSDYSGLKVTIPAGYHNGSGYVRAHSNAAFCFCKTHDAGAYHYITFNPSTGMYYTLSSISEINTNMMFVVLWEGTGFTNVLDIMFIGTSSAKNTSYTGDFRCWKDSANVYVEKIGSNKIANNTGVGAVVLSFVGQ